MFAMYDRQIVELDLLELDGQDSYFDASTQYYISMVHDHETSDFLQMLMSQYHA